MRLISGGAAFAGCCNTTISLACSFQVRNSGLAKGRIDAGGWTGASGRGGICVRGMCFRRWRCSCRLAQRFQEFPDALFVGFRSRSLNGLWNFRLRWRTLRRLTSSLRLFLRFLGDTRNQPRDRDDRGDDDENDVLVEVHWVVTKLKKLQGYKGFGPCRCNLVTVVTFLTDYEVTGGLSVPAIDSRIEVSACTFFIRT